MFTLGSLYNIDPNDIAEGLKPTKRLSGVYKFRRVPLDTEITMEEPPGAPMVVALDPVTGQAKMQARPTTYVFEVFEFERYLKQVLRVEESIRIRLMDMLWNFLYVCWDSRVDRIWCPRSSEA